MTCVVLYCVNTKYSEVIQQICVRNWNKLKLLIVFLSSEQLNCYDRIIESWELDQSNSK